MNNILNLLTQDERKYLRKANVNKGQMLFHEDENCQEVGMVENGELEIVSYTKEGGEIIYRKITSGMMFGNNLIFSSDTSYKGNVIAKTDSLIYFIKKDNLIQIFRQNTHFLLEFLKYQSDMGKELNAQIKLLTISNAEQRFFYFAHLNNNVIRYKTITSLAASIYLQRETLSRLITKLEKENKIIRRHKVIKIVI